METFEEFLRKRESIVKKWTLNSSVYPTLLMIVLYLFMAKIAGPKFMKNRLPYKLKWIIRFYNIFQIIFNVWMFIKIDIIKFSPYLYRSETYNFEEDYELTLISVTWWFYINKIIDFLDSFFMVLRKKNSQLNFLHLYHHPATLYMAWFHLNYGPGYFYILAWFMNSIIHSIMYFYYFMASFGPKFQKFLWWKKYLTKIQIIQFVIILLVIPVTNLKYDAPLYIHLMCAMNPGFLLVLFMKFYMKTYKIKK